MPVRKYNAANVIDENAGLPADDPRAFHPEGEDGPYGGIPGIFKELTDEAGLNYEVHIEAVSAKTLAFHYEHALSVIARPGWDAVVLQGSSTEPLPVGRGGKPESFLKHAALLEKAIHVTNPHARVFLEQTWPRADLVYPEGAPYHGIPLGVMVMAEDLHEACERVQMHGEFEGWGVRVGDEWATAINKGVAQANPYLAPEPGKLDLWGPDYYHPSVYGAYLAAVNLFCDVAWVSSTTLQPDEQAAHDLGISPADAARLQRYGAIVIDQRSPARPSQP